MPNSTSIFGGGVSMPEDSAITKPSVMFVKDYIQTAHIKSMIICKIGGWTRLNAVQITLLVKMTWFRKCSEKWSQGSTNQNCNTYLNHFVLFRAVLPTHSEEIEEFFVTLICHKYMENKNSFPP